MSTAVAGDPVWKQKARKPKIDLVLSLREPMRRGEKTELRKTYNLPNDWFFTVIPHERGPWGPSLRSLPTLPLSPQSSDILILVDPETLDDIWNIFMVLPLHLDRDHALVRPHLLGFGSGRYVARLIAGAGKVG